MNRDLSLDTMRGLAILAMVISGIIAFGGNQPVWMYHAQAVTSAYVSNSTPPITWNDLVFPFFVFSMGAAIPLSLSKRLSAGKSKLSIVLDVAIRSLMLLIFGIFLEHVKPFEISNQPGFWQWVTSLSGFVLLTLLYFRYPANWKIWKLWLIRLVVLGIGVFLILNIHYLDGSGFDLYRNDILFMLIANNVFFGSIIWLFTQNRPLLRIALIPLLFSVLIAGDLHGSWNKLVLDATPFAWMYHFDYLGYLFIVIPGTLAGDFMYRHNLKYSTDVPETVVESEDHGNKVALMSLSIGILVLNIVFISLRYLLFNLVSNVLLIIAILWVWNGIKSPQKEYYKKYLELGSYTLLLAIFFEAYQGGLKREYSTFSYFFFGSGLAMFLLLSIIICFDLSIFRKPLLLISMIGKNPMVAYMSANLLFIPIYHFIGLNHFPEWVQAQSWEGWVSGIFTAIFVACISIQFTRMNWYLKT